jgi:hypothetical protein
MWPVDASPDIESAEGRRVTADPAGRFRFVNVSPGDYRIVAVQEPAWESQSGTFSGRIHTQVPFRPITPLGSAQTLWSEAVVNVTERSDHALRLQLERAPTVSGRVRFSGSGSRPGPEQLLATPVEVMPAFRRFAGLLNSPVGRLESDGRFTSVGVTPGMYTLGFTTLTWGPASWSIASIVIEGKEVAGLPFHVGPSDVVDAMVTVHDRASELTGSVRGGPSANTTDVFAVVFPRDPNLRLHVIGARGVFTRLRLALVDRHGRFRLRVVPGDYLVAAVSTADIPVAWQAPEFLATLARVATPVQVSLGQRADVSVAAPRRPQS